MTSEDWIATLKIATESQDRHQANIPKSIVLKKDQYLALERSQFSDDTYPLTLSEIIEISLNKLKETRQKYLSNQLQEHDFINDTNDLVDYTLQLIHAYKLERDHPFKHLIRKGALVVSFLLSFFFKLKDEKNFQDVFTQYEDEILLENENNFQTLIRQKLKHIPILLEDLKKQFKDNRRQELIQDQFVGDWEDENKIPPNLRPIYNEEFERDFKRGASFLRKDEFLHIEDQEAIPFKDLDNEQKVQQAASAIQDLLIKNEDERWFKILQIAVTQATILTAFKAILSAFNVDESNIQWKRKGKYYSIKLIFSHHLYPVYLEIIRPPETKIIEKVNVTLKGSLDIVKYCLEGDESPSVLFPNVITEELQYTLVLDQNNRPVISDLHSETKSNSLLNQEVSLVTEKLISS